MLSYNERGIRKLQENFACFHDKLAEEDVYQSFLAIVGKSKKFAKPEVKVDLGFFCYENTAILVNLNCSHSSTIVQIDSLPLRAAIVVLNVQGTQTYT